MKKTVHRPDAKNLVDFDIIYQFCMAFHDPKIRKSGMKTNCFTVEGPEFLRPVWKQNSSKTPWIFYDLEPAKKGNKFIPFSAIPRALFKKICQRWLKISISDFIRQLYVLSALAVKDGDEYPIDYVFSLSLESSSEEKYICIEKRRLDQGFGRPANLKVMVSKKLIKERERKKDKKKN